MIGMMAQKLKNLQKQYQILLNELQERKKKAPPGRLEIDRTRKQPRYYCCREGASGKRRREYLSADQQPIAQALAQKAYEQKMEQLLTARLYFLDRFCADFADSELEAVYADLSPERRSLVQPLVTPWPMRVAQWLQKPIPPVQSPSKPGGLLTNRGDCVRSKSEKILADLFFDQKIPYKYECPLLLSSKIFFPDFTFLSPRSGKELYWEHLGMMGDEEYAKRAMEKLLLYDRHDIQLGRNLILTFETNTLPLDVTYARRLVDRYLRP